MHSPGSRVPRRRRESALPPAASVAGSGVFSCDAGDYGSQIAFEMFGAVHLGQAVREPEEEPAEEGNNGEGLCLDELLINRCADWLDLGDGRFTDRDESSREAIEHRPQFSVARRDHHQLEAGPCP